MGKPDREKEILASQAFRAINLLIDQHAHEAKLWASSLVSISREIAPPSRAWAGEISLRTHDECPDGAGKTINVGIDLFELERISTAIKYVEFYKRTIEELVRFKLRLLNDYDFTHGDDTEQKHVFGAVP